MELQTFILDKDQPTNCPECGRRTNFEELGNGQQAHWCRCGFEFVGEFDPDDDMPRRYEIAPVVVFNFRNPYGDCIEGHCMRGTPEQIAEFEAMGRDEQEAFARDHFGLNDYETFDNLETCWSLYDNDNNSHLMEWTSDHDTFEEAAAEYAELTGNEAPTKAAWYMALEA